MPRKQGFTHRKKITKRAPSPESIPSDLELFDRSDSPTEFYDDEDTLWPVKGVVGEEVDLFNASM